MPLNPVSPNGDMYDFIDDTWNTIKGRCPFDCPYCYMKKWGEQKPIRFDASELDTDLGQGKFIFVGSSCDMWADAIPDQWIRTTLLACGVYENKYLFQSKNPKRFLEFKDYLPRNVVLCTTIESDRDLLEALTSDIPARPPEISERVNWMCKCREAGYPVTVTIEPIMDFDPSTLLELIGDIGPEWVSVGADSQGHHLPEPESEKVKLLLSELERNKKIKLVTKKNIWRLV